jgi:alpha-ketoglutarate-dependent taurine dioxygenase
VYTNPQSGVTGFFLSPLQIFYFIDNGVSMTEEASKPILEKLMAYITQEKFMYHHDWQNGDLILSDQWFSIHKRWKFDGMATRLLHRMESDFSKISFLQ